jgi:protein required for attachment to host cells
MFHAQRGPGITHNNNKTWILVANRSEARLFSAVGNSNDLQLVENLYHPEGRLKGRDLFTDHVEDESSSLSEILRQFARNLSERLNKGRAQNAFSKLVLIADSKLLGEIRAGLDRITRHKINVTYDKDLAHLEPNLLKSQLKKLLSA